MLALTMMFWAGNAIVGRAVRADIPPFTLALGRWLVALLILTPLAWRHIGPDWPEICRRWRAILFLGLVGVAAFNGFLYSGLRHTTASNGLLLQALIPSIVLFIGVSGFRDKVPLAQIAGVLLSTAGVAVIVFRGEAGAILQLRLGLGDGLIMAGCFAWAAYTACLRLRPAIQPITFIFITFAIGAAAMLPLAAGEAHAIAAMHWRPRIFAAFAYVGIFPSVCAYFLYNAAVAQIGAGAAGQTISLMPVFGALLATKLLGERLHAYHGVGMALILGGIVLAWAIGARSSRRHLP